MVWGGKGVHETWFSAKPAVVHGINWLPFHGGSLYLGRQPEYVARDHAALVRENGGERFDDWPCLAMMFCALNDPRAALRQLDSQADSIKIEAGNSRANLFHWLHGLAALGRVDAATTADYPISAVFAAPGRKTYVVHNLAAEPRKVRFSDGTVLDVRPGRLESRARAVP
jgi:hypothetical protein